MRLPNFLLVATVCHLWSLCSCHPIEVSINIDPSDSSSEGELQSPPFVCGLRQGTNVSADSTSFVPARFSTTATDCCSACAGTAGCIAAVWWSYYCHMFNRTVGPLVPATGVVFVYNDALTTTTTTTTTTTAPTTTTTNAPVPTTTTAAPPSPPPMPPSRTVVREVSCEYSAQCSRMDDDTCTTTVYYNSTCTSEGKMYLCSPGVINIDTFHSAQCVPPARHILEEAQGCSMTEDETYIGHFCDTFAAEPVAGLSVKRTYCPMGCDDGGECNRADLTTGVCTKGNPVSTIISGKSVMAWCYPTYVVFLGYAGASCEGPFISSTSEPTGTRCFLDQNQAHIQNICGSP